MTIAEQLLNSIQDLPEELQKQVLDYSEYLKTRTIQEERIAWSNLSLESAMRGMEGEDSDYSMADIREAFHDR
ncbi:DUF2281 domain-containing protein [Leptonema illini]|jgi:hypothetical protein|uniref:Uncharacterized protein n=1 Tax=Leptonema illini DSM 21528 TaxID=929563 RepID=H2CJU3_9LEPT|nr:DUF2281 domain-containing protein [Leptonema illini]EHQ05007.1 Protein of unknown function DUF2281 [Leptonema illini DSM 21528]PKL33212.1 MAG: DUF2281 domain-containing protein [Spirochaetae bacterium HGW-Spirochaetae-10]